MSKTKSDREAAGESNADGIYYDGDFRPRAGGRARVQGGLYVAIPRGYCGFTVDHFLCDPCGPWEDGVPRTPSIVEREKGANDAVATIDPRAYPFVPDYVEEARVYGVSFRIPRTFDFSQLTPGESGLALVHSRGMAAFSIDRQGRSSCPYRRCRLLPDVTCGFHAQAAEYHETDEAASFVCLGNAWPLSALTFAGEAHKPLSLRRKKGGLVECEIATPTVRYDVELPVSLVGEAPDIRYHPGVVMRFPMFYLEFVSRTQHVPGDLKRRIKSNGLEMTVCPE